MTARRFVATRTVRLGDVGLDGTLRLDALARFLQDVAADDAADVGLREATWVVRRTALDIAGRPRFGERIELTTSCGGLGSRWAERRTLVAGPTSSIDAASVWVHVDTAGRPAALPPRFLDAYAEAAGGRTVSSRLTLPAPGSGADAPRPWPLRPTDFDVLGHVNNSVYWAMVEDDPLLDGIAELEYRTPIDPGTEVELVVDRERRARWLVSGAGVHAAARTTSRPSASTMSPAL